MWRAAQVVVIYETLYHTQTLRKYWDHSGHLIAAHLLHWLETTGSDAEHELCTVSAAYAQLLLLCWLRICRVEESLHPYVGRVIYPLRLA